MKKLLVIFLFTFAVIVGFSGSVSAAPVHHGHSSLAHTPNLVVAPNIVVDPFINVVVAPIIASPGAKQIIDSPGAILADGDVVSKTGGDTFNVFGGKANKSTINIGGNIKTVGNTVF